MRGGGVVGCQLPVASCELSVLGRIGMRALFAGCSVVN